MIRYAINDVGFNPDSIVTVGTFDGLHVGHQKILRMLVDKSRAIGSRSVAITFKPHPQEIIGHRKVELLMTEEERVQAMVDSGIDEVCLVKFDRDFSMVTAEDFLVNMVHGKIGLKELVLGYNHTFGRGAEGTVEFARRVGAQVGFKVDFVDAVMIGGKAVSTSNIRKLIKEGNIDVASEMLGKPYSVEGYVITGNKRGRTLGYPTANINPIDDRLLYPAFGVYIVEVLIDDERLVGLASVGVRPTFEDTNKVMLEVWIADFDRDIYGKKVRVFFVHRLREELKFNSPEELITQMDDDRRLLNEYLVKTSNKQKQEFQ